MLIGISLTDFKTPERADSLLGRIADMGYACLQMSLGSMAECGFSLTPEFEIPEAISSSAVEKIMLAADSNKMKISALNGTWNMAHPDKEIRDEGLRRSETLIRAAVDMGSPIVTLCSGSRNRQHLWRSHEDNRTEAAWEDMLDSMKRMCALAEKYGVMLALETEASNVVDRAPKAKRLLEAVGSDKMGMIMDCANLFHKGEATQSRMRPAIDEAFACYGDKVVLAHGKDIRPSEGIDFCGTGMGIVDFPYMIGKLRETGRDVDMILHGIYKESDMPLCLDYMRNVLEGTEK